MAPLEQGANKGQITVSTFHQHPGMGENKISVTAAYVVEDECVVAG
jgi:hypothetical protein